jgi:hypothetical protein
MVRFCVVLALLVSLGLGSGVAEDKKKDAPKDKKEASIVGTWEGAIPELKGVKLIMTFTAEGKFSMETSLEDLPKMDNVKIDNGKKEGTYKLADKKLTVSTGGKDKVFTIKELTATKALIANDQGVEVAFTKKK